MTQHDSLVAFRHMLEYARRARFISADKSAEDIESDELLSLAVPRALELVGEAATRVPDDERAKHPEIEWRRIVGFRNVLIHGYEQIDFGIVHTILNHQIDGLIAALESIVDVQDAESPE